MQCKQPHSCKLPQSSLRGGMPADLPGGSSWRETMQTSSGSQHYCKAVMSDMTGSGNWLPRFGWPLTECWNVFSGRLHCSVSRHLDAACLRATASHLSKMSNHIYYFINWANTDPMGLDMHRADIT